MLWPTPVPKPAKIVSRRSKHILKKMAVLSTAIFFRNQKSEIRIIKVFGAKVETKTHWEKKNNPVVNKSKKFAIRIIGLYKYLTEKKQEYVISKQILRSGTSIGANIREAHRGYSDSDFYAKLTISLKEADETAYWLELLLESNFLSLDEFDSIYKDCEEIIRMLVTITKHRNHNKQE